MTTCICKMSPEHSARSKDVGLEQLNMLLDHRCPKHGEKAQPALWGRHKELELLVTPEQWRVLGKEIGPEVNGQPTGK
jgi:hypothetical protein